jgi:hypothetical protein
MVDRVKKVVGATFSELKKAEQTNTASDQFFSLI